MTKKREIGPFKFPPCEITEGLYSARQPFIKIERGRLGTLPENKFRGGKMPAETLDLAIAEAGEPYVFVERMFGRSEMNLRPAHVMALGIPGWFAKPTGEEWLNFVAGNHRWTKRSLKEFMRSVAGADVVPNADNRGLLVERHVEPEEENEQEDEVNNLSSSSDEEAFCNSKYESSEDMRAASCREAVLVYTNSRRDCKRFVARQEVRPQLPPDPKVLVLSAECKDEVKGSIQGLYQSASCADPGIIRNVENGHGNPVDLLCMGETTGYHGLLVVDGIVEISTSKTTGENIITERAYEKYKDTCLTTNTKSLFTHAELIQKLKVGLTVLRDCNTEREHFPSRKYVVGKLYVPSSNTDSLKLPTTLKEGRLFDGGGRMFIEGLMRVVIGEAVLQWTPRRLLAAKLVRLAILHEAMRQAGVPPGLASANKRFELYLHASLPPEARKLEVERMFAGLQAGEPLFVEHIAAGLRVLGGDAVEKIQAELARLAAADAELEASSLHAPERPEEQKGIDNSVVKIDRVKREIEVKTGKRKRDAGTSRSNKSSGSASARHA